MKINKKKAMLIGLASSVLFNTAACGSNREPNVYGPPEENVSTDENIVEAVYGPPEDFGITEAPDIEDTEDADAPDIDENIAPTVYGPPEMFTEE